MIGNGGLLICVNMILQKNGNVFRNYHEKEESYHVERTVKLMDIDEWRRLVFGKCQQRCANRCVVGHNLELAGFKKLIQHKDMGRSSSCAKRLSLFLKSTSRAGNSCGRLRNEVMIPRASDLEGAAQEILTSSGLDTNFQLTLKDGKGNSLTLAWTHIDPDETEARNNKRRDSRIRPDQGVAKKRQLIEGDFKQWLVTKLARRGTS